MKLTILVLSILVTSSLAKAAITPSEALQASEAAPEVKAIYSVYLKNHYDGHACDGCAVVGANAVAQEEVPKVKLQNCTKAEPTLPDFFSCNALIKKDIYTNDDYVHELQITTWVQKSKDGIVVQVQDIKIMQELND